MVPSAPGLGQAHSLQGKVGEPQPARLGERNGAQVQCSGAHRARGSRSGGRSVPGPIPAPCLPSLSLAQLVVKGGQQPELAPGSLLHTRSWCSRTRMTAVPQTNGSAQVRALA